MTDSTLWKVNKAKERSSHNMVKTILEISGYKVTDFGIEKLNPEIVEKIKNYKFETNRRLLSMPDLIVVDEEKTQAYLVEVKHREYNGGDLIMSYGEIKGYLDFWQDAIIIFTFDGPPWFLCVRVNKINWETHLIKKISQNGETLEIWNFGTCPYINDIFTKITKHHYLQALEATGHKEELPSFFNFMK